VLKITHSPYVAAIWAYENLEDYCVKSRGTNQSLRGSAVVVVGGGGAAAKKKKGPTTPMQTTTSNNTIDSDLGRESGDRSRPGGRNRPVSSGDPDDDDDMRALVLKLMAKVDRLSDMVSSQQRQLALTAGAQQQKQR
jgi:hypothetical protein